MADKKIRLLVQAEVKKAVKALNKIEKEQKDIKKNNDGLKKGFKAVGGAIAAAFAFKAAASFLKESAKIAASTQSLERNFVNLGKGVGISRRSLDKFRKATDGTVKDTELMIQANNAMLLGIVESDDQFAELIDNAQRLAKAVGKDAAFGIESLTTGIGRQSKLMLDNLGIIVDTQKAYDVYAESINKSTSELDDNERKQAFIQATMESVRVKVAQLGAEQLDANDSFAQASVAFDDFKRILGNELLPLIPPMITGFLEAYDATKDFFEQFTGTSADSTIDKLRELGLETTNLEKAQLENNIAQNENVLISKGLVATEEELIKKKNELESAQNNLTLAIGLSGKAEQEALNDGMELNEEMNDLRKETAIDLVSHINPITAVIRNLTKDEQDLAIAHLSTREAVDGEIASREKSVTIIEEELLLMQENINLRNQLAEINAPIPIPVRPKIIIDSEDDDIGLDDFVFEETELEDFHSPFIEAFGISELARTDILKAAALERQEIRREEELGEVPMSIFEESVKNMEITEAAKTKLIEEHSKRRRDFEAKAHKERIEENLESAILSGQSAKEAALSVIKAEIAEAQAGLISSIMQSVPFPLNLAIAAGAGSMIGKVTDELLSFETGGSFVAGLPKGNNRASIGGGFITKGRTTLPIGNGVVVGDNASGMERIDVTPLPSPTSSGSNIVVNINAPVVDEFVVDSIIPAIRRAEKLNL